MACNKEYFLRVNLPNDKSLLCHMKSVASVPEHEVLLEVARGNEEAFSELFNSFKKHVYSFSYHYTHSSFLAEEITQEVFMKVWLNRLRLPEIERFEAWLMTITRNACLNQLKKRANELKFKGSLVVSETGSHDTADLYKDKEDLLKQALNHLSPKQKQIFHLKLDLGIRTNEIAHRLNISHNTVKVHIVEALRRIRQYMQQHTVSIIPMVFLGYYFF